MGFEDELKKIHILLDLYHKGGISNTNALLKQWLSFLDTLEKEMVVGDEEQREYLKREVKILIERVQEEINLLVSRVGMTQEEAQEKIENSENYDPERWRSFQELQRNIQNRMKSLTPLLSPEATKEPPSAPKSRKKTINKIRTHRKKWLRT